MNDQEVYIVSGSDEIYLGTVGELIEGNSSSWKIGQGISFATVISDIVNRMISVGEIDTYETFTIQFRDPEKR